MPSAICDARDRSEPSVPNHRETDNDDQDRLPMAEELVALADRQYRFGIATDRRPYAVARRGIKVALPFRASAPGDLASELAHLYFQENERVVSATAIRSALQVLEGRARQMQPRDVHLRLARRRNEIYVDLGDQTGRAARVSPTGWDLVDRPPVLFWRTELSGPLPTPDPEGSLDAVRSLFNVEDATWDLIVALLVITLVPGVPHPIMLITGEQGTGKSSLVRMFVELTDPSSATFVPIPTGQAHWALLASSSWVLALDNLSYIAPWFSDALCRAVTGDAYVARQLYTNTDLTVLSFQRVIIMDAIDPGSLRGDLADRIVPIELERITGSRKRSDARMRRRFYRLRPAAFGGLLTLLSQTLAVERSIRLDQHPRMADFVHWLAAVDEVRGSSTVQTYLNTFGEVAEVVVDSDPVGQALVQLVERERSWEGTAGELLELLPVPDHGRWPQSAKAMGGKLRRLAPALRQLGIAVDWYRAPGTDRRRMFTVRAQDGE
jgi:hypothetical protein